MFRRVEDFKTIWQQEADKTLAVLAAIPDAAAHQAVDALERDLGQPPRRRDRERRSRMCDLGLQPRRRGAHHRAASVEVARPAVRALTSNAALMAFSTASAPELKNKVFLAKSPGASTFSRSARRT